MSNLKKCRKIWIIPVLEDEKECARLPIMFYVYGGAFALGDGTDGLYGPDLLMENRVILITINYRLGPFGFWNFEMPGLTGNMGIKDLQVGLKWVKTNARFFGGDPDAITVFGQSAGKLQELLLTQIYQFMKELFIALHFLFNDDRFIRRSFNPYTCTIWFKIKYVPCHCIERQCIQLLCILREQQPGGPFVWSFQRWYEQSDGQPGFVQFPYERYSWDDCTENARF